jgi:hypothetical protein
MNQQTLDGAAHGFIEEEVFVHFWFGVGSLSLLKHKYKPT